MAEPVLLWGDLADPPLKAVHDTLVARGAAFAVLDDGADAARVELELADDFAYPYADGDLTDFRAAYLRPQEVDGGVAAARARRLLYDWAEYVCPLAINRPSADATNHSKLAQAARIRQAGFATPLSIVSNDIDEIRAFAAELGTVVYKSLSSVRSVVRELDPALLPAEPMGPAFFQERVEGRNVRVHVVEKMLFAHAIDSDAVDYRYGDARVQPCVLPDDVARRCVDLAALLGLLVAGVDLIVTPDGEWYCLEVNPNPGFTFYDASIASAIGDVLLR